MKMVALIPARAGSKRIPGKNTKLLAGHPLIAYTIAAARESEVFSEVWVSSDDALTLALASVHGADTIRRSDECATDESPDVGWVKETLSGIGFSVFDSFAILRPTSPFRTAAAIRRAYDQFKRSEVHSIRAVQPVKEHPGKMWQVENGCLTPLLTGDFPVTRGWDQGAGFGHPWHSRPTQTLPSVYVQNASLEMAWTYVVKSFGTISGRKIAPFFTEGYEGYDINDPEDWATAERLIEEGLVELPSLPLAGV
jgi:CMP-N,N'-diacetyllegionaminic acid synthase